MDPYLTAQSLYTLRTSPMDLSVQGQSELLRLCSDELVLLRKQLVEAEREINGLKLRCEVVETTKPELAQLDLENQNRHLLQVSERHQANEASAMRKLQAMTFKLKAARCAEMASFWENYNIRSQLKRAESVIELFRSMSSLNPLALGEHIPATLEAGYRRVSDLEPVSVAGATQPDLQLPSCTIGPVLFINCTDFHWFSDKPEHGLLLKPSHLYKPSKGFSDDLGVWERTPVIDYLRNLPVDVFYLGEAKHWYYAGTFQTMVLRTGTHNIFNSLTPAKQDAIVLASAERHDFIPPLLLRTFREMYRGGALSISCVLFEQVGFNQELYTEMLQMRKQDISKSMDSNTRLENLAQDNESGPSLVCSSTPLIYPFDLPSSQKTPNETHPTDTSFVSSTSTVAQSEPELGIARMKSLPPITTLVSEETREHNAIVEQPPQPAQKPKRSGDKLGTGERAAKKRKSSLGQSQPGTEESSAPFPGSGPSNLPEEMAAVVKEGRSDAKPLKKKAGVKKKRQESKDLQPNAAQYTLTLSTPRPQIQIVQAQGSSEAIPILLSQLEESRRAASESASSSITLTEENDTVLELAAESSNVPLESGSKETVHGEVPCSTAKSTGSVIRRKPNQRRVNVSD